MVKLYRGDCLIESDKIESGSVDLILTDLPYGTVKGAQLDGWGADSTKWDTVIDINKIYNIANRILRKNGKMVLFCQEPFTTDLISRALSNLPLCYRLIWEKDHFANALFAKKAPVNYFEDILVFTKKHEFEGLHPLRLYFKDVMAFIGLNLKEINKKLGHRRAEHTFYIDSSQYGLCTEKTYTELCDVFGLREQSFFKEFAELLLVDAQFKKEFASTFNLWDGKKFKSNILKYKKDYQGLHPTQKPVLLLEDLIKTYSNPTDLVVDLTMGSGSTGESCMNTGRKFIGIEMDEGYFEIAKNRIEEVNIY